MGFVPAANSSGTGKVMKKSSDQSSNERRNLHSKSKCINKSANSNSNSNSSGKKREFETPVGSKSSNEWSRKSSKLNPNLKAQVFEDQSIITNDICDYEFDNSQCDEPSNEPKLMANIEPPMERFDEYGKIETNNMDEKQMIPISHRRRSIDSLRANSEHDSIDEFKKQSHCEIEKRRRDKMNHYIMRLATMIPSFKNNSAKFDKLTVLRMAVQHVKSLRSSLCSFSSFHMRPPFLSSGNLLKNLILQMASQEAQDNLFMVVTCDRGKVLFVSQSSSEILNQDQDELIGQCLFDMLHKDDVSKVKEQISFISLQPKDRLVDSKTLQPIKSSHQRQSFNQIQNKLNSAPQPGSRRSFFCRMRLDPMGFNETSKCDLSFVSSNSHFFSSSSSFPSSSSPTSSSSASSSSAATATPKSSTASQKTESETNESSQVAADDSKADSSSTDRDANVETNPSLPHPPVTKLKKQNDSQIEQDYLKTPSSESLKSAEPATVESIDTQTGQAPLINITTGSDQGPSNDQRDLFLTPNGTSFNDFPDRFAPNMKFPKDSKRKEQNRKSHDKKHASKQALKTNILVSKKRLRYILMHCTGYLRLISLGSQDCEDEDDEYDDSGSEKNSIIDDDCDQSKDVMCLVAVCRRSPMNLELEPDRPLTFTCRYSMEGKFVFVDQKTTIALGYTPQQLLGTSHYAYCHKDSVNTFKECHRQSILKSEPVSSDIYQFKRANGENLWLQTSLRSFRNPWTKFIDYIVANHTTAESNNPLFNEGCVSAKYSRDNTGEGSQSASPASSSSLSTDSKKSTSPSSSSLASSNSLESCASNSSIQALLHHIDRLKSGGVKHALNFRTKHPEIRTSRSGPINKSTDDSGAYSDHHSCSSLSSHNSGGSTEFNQGINNNFVECASSQVPTSNPMPVTFTGQKVTTPFRATPVTHLLTNYITPPQHIGSQATTVNTTLAYAAPIVTSNTGNKVSSRVYRPMNSSNKPTENPFEYRNSPKATQRSSNVIATTREGSWAHQVVSVYDCPPSSQSENSSIPASIPLQVVVNPVDNNSCQTSSKIDSRAQYEMHVVAPSLELVQDDVSIPNQMNAMGPESYNTGMMPVVSYVNQDVGSHYANPGLNSMQQSIRSQVPMDQQLEPIRTHTVNDPMGMTIMYNNSQTDPYQSMNSLSSSQAGQLCGTVNESGSVMLPQSIVQCQQCANHRCHGLQMTPPNNTDLNSINLTSLGVDGDLDEDQLLEYLAGCDPESQFYNMQVNTYSQYNNQYR